MSASPTGLKAPRRKEDVALLQLLVKRGKLSKLRFGEIRRELARAGGSGATYDPIQALIEGGEVALEDWYELLETYETQYFTCPSCGSFLRTRSAATKLKCGKCEETFRIPADERRVTVVPVGAPPPGDDPLGRQSREEGWRDDALLTLAIDRGWLSSEDARWAVEAQRKAAAEQTRMESMGPVLVAAGLLGADQIAELELTLEQGYTHHPTSGLLVARDTMPEAPPAAVVAIARVEAASTSRLPVRRRTRARRDRTPAAPPRLTREEAERLRAARARVGDLRAELDALEQRAASEAEEAPGPAEDAAIESVTASPPEPVEDPRVDTSKIKAVPGDQDLQRSRAKSPGGSITKVRRRVAATDETPAAARKPGADRRPALEAPTDPGAPTIGGADLAELIATAGKGVLDLSGMTITDKLDLSGKKLAKLVCKKTCFNENVDLRGCTFAEKVVLRQATFMKELDARDCTFTGGADLAITQFGKQARFTGSVFSRYTNFREATFHKVARFTRTRFTRGGGFDRCQFHDDASFNDLYFGHRAKFEKCTFDGGVTFSNASFNDVFDLSGSTFAREAKFIAAEFDKTALFNKVTFAGPAILTGAQFEGEASWRGVSFGDRVSLKALSAERSLLFAGNTYGKDARFELTDMHVARFIVGRKDLEGRIESHRKGKYAQARHEYGLLKTNFKQINNYVDEDWAYLMEKRMARKAIRLDGPRSYLRRFFDWLALDLACGYGTRPLNILFAALAIVTGFAALFRGLHGTSTAFALEGHGPEEFRLADALLFSFKTFTGSDLSTWELISATSPINYLVAFEGFCGIFVMTVLVVTFSRKVIR